MTEPQFTAGPWRVSPNSLEFGANGILFIESHDAGYETIIVVVGQPIERGDIEVYPELNRQKVANAHLIAAAPELYAALAEAQQAMDDYLNFRGSIGFEARHKAAAVLAKARGEEPPR